MPFWWSLGGGGHVADDAGQRGRGRGAPALGHRALPADQALADINGRDPERIREWEQPTTILNFGFLCEANTYAWRSPQVSLASRGRPPLRRDARPGPRLAGHDRRRRAGVHHPPDDRRRETTDWRDDGEPGYWTGEASMPRSAQHERTGDPHLPAGLGRDHRRPAVARVRLPALHPRLRAPGPLRRGRPGGPLDHRRARPTATSPCGRGGRRPGAPTTRRSTPPTG